MRRTFASQSCAPILCDYGAETLNVVVENPNPMSPSLSAFVGAVGTLPLVKPHASIPSSLEYYACRTPPIYHNVDWPSARPRFEWLEGVL